jgi:choline-glycine betaine transporter
MLHKECDANDFDGTCSLKIDGNELNKEECTGLRDATTISWVAGTPAHCWAPGTAPGTVARSPDVDKYGNWSSKDNCKNACDDCQTYFPPSFSDSSHNIADWQIGKRKICPCPCPKWIDEEDGPGGQNAHCRATGSGVGSTSLKDLNDLLEDIGGEQACKELTTMRPVWTEEQDNDDYKRPIMLNKKVLTAADVQGLSQTQCAAVQGKWKAATPARVAAPLTGQAAIVAAPGACLHYDYGCPAKSTKYNTEDAFDSDHYDGSQDWSANDEFAKYKKWIAAKFSWFYIGSQDVWIVFIIVVYFSKYSDIKLCKKGEEMKEPEYSDASWFSMLFCSGIGVGLFYYGVAEPVWHYSDASAKYGNRFNRNPNLTDEQVAQEAMNITFFHWGLHGFVVYTQVGLILGLMSYRWGLPMTMKSCFYPLLGEAVFGVIGDVIDIMSVITTLFGVCTSLGLGTMQLAQGLQRLTYDERTGESAIINTKGTQVAVVAFITVIATISVVSGIKNGIQRLSNIAFTMGLMILFVGFFHGDSWYMLNVFVQSVGYYIQWIIQLGTTTSAFATSPFELWDAHGTDLSPSTSPADTAGATHSMLVESEGWMDGWTLFYWGWWIAWSPFVGTFMAKISKGRTIKQFILGSCILPITFGFIWFSVFGGVGINMVRDAKAMGVTSTWSGKAEAHQQVIAVLETTRLPHNGTVTGRYSIARPGTISQSIGFKTAGRYGCSLQSEVHSCAADVNCEYKYLRPPSLLINLAGRQKEDMWYDTMLSYGEPDAFMGWFLFVFSMMSLVLYFVTSSDSGSLVIDILSANGVDEPPTIQRIFWALTEGVTASALLIAGEKKALDALSTVSICAGLPYTVLLCFTCISTWRALKMDAGDLKYDKKTEFTTALSDVVLSLSNYPKFFLNLFVPSLVIHKYPNIWYVIMSTVLFYLWPFCILFNIHSEGWWTMGWMFYLMFTLIVWDIRVKTRKAKGINGNMVEDFFAVFLFYPGVLIQLDNENFPELFPELFPEPATETQATETKATETQPTETKATD